MGYGLMGGGVVDHGLMAYGLVGYGLMGYGLVGYGLVGYEPAGYGPVGYGLAGHGLMGDGHSFKRSCTSSRRRNAHPDESIELASAQWVLPSVTSGICGKRVSQCINDPWPDSP